MSQISAKIVADSISQGKRITTFELNYPRFIHSELMTHRVFSRNAMSSRAVPIEKMIEQVKNDPAFPLHWGQNQSGMQATNTLSKTLTTTAKYIWKQSAASASFFAEQFVKIGLHKQVTNRILEPYQLMKTVLTSTEFENFYWLRNHEDAQPEIKKLAEEMLKAQEQSVPVELEPGEWHVPYYADGVWRDSKYVNNEMKALYNKRDSNSTLENALAISSSCCAQVSYRKLDDTLEKAHMVYKRLVESEPVHASPFEHQATPMKYPSWPVEQCNNNLPESPCTWEDGITHMDSEMKFWSGNFAGWVQHRQLIKNNVVRG